LTVVENACCGGHWDVSIGLQLPGHPWFIGLRRSDVHDFGGRKGERQTVPIKRIVHVRKPPLISSIDMRLSSIPLPFVGGWARLVHFLHEEG
jgi:hypothetical protein